MFEELGRLLTQNGFLPHGYCLTWSPALLGTYLFGDGLTAISYFSLPAAIGYFAWRRKDFPYPWILWMFVAFILSCGLTHLLGTIVLWRPFYWLDATLKAITGVVSALTAILLWRLIPTALSIPGVDEFRAVNNELTQEIAERKRVEEELRQASQELKELQERHFRQVVESLPQMIWTCRGDGAADYFSPQWIEYTGRAAEDSYGDAWLDALHPDDRQSVIQLWQDAVAEKRDYLAHFRIRRHDGKYRWFSTRATPLFDQKGNIGKWFGSNTDVHDLKIAQEALQAILENAPVLISMTDTESRIVLANKAMFERLPLPPADQFIGQSILEALPGPAGQDLWAKDQESIRRDRAMEEEECLNHRDGSRHIYLTLRFPVRDTHTRALTGVCTISTDITERKAAEALVQRLNEELEERVRRRTAELEHSNEALLHSNIELQRFAHAAAHDLQTPLRSIVGFTQMLKEEVQACMTERVQELMTLIISNTERLHILIRDLLAYSRLDAEARPFEPVDLQGVFDQVVETLAAPIGETGAEITSGQLPVVIADRGQIAQVLQNLIENGIKYNHANPPRVTVTCKKRDDEWVFAIADNGIGVDPRHHERIFEIFRRLHTHHDIPGSGIGLAICFRVVERHGGRIWVESEAGRGSTFYFSLPARPEE